MLFSGGYVSYFDKKNFVQTLRLDYEHLPAINKDCRESRHFFLQKCNPISLNSKIQNGALRTFVCPIPTDHHRQRPGHIPTPLQQLCLSIFLWKDLKCNSTSWKGRWKKLLFCIYSGVSNVPCETLWKAMVLSVSRRTVPYRNTCSFSPKFPPKHPHT